MNLKSTKYNFLFQKYINEIYSYSVFMVGNKFDADDVVQDVLIKMWENIDNFNVLSAKAWMIKTTHNRCIDMLRKRNVSMKNETPMEENFMEHASPDDLNSRISDRITSEHILEKVKSLPDNLRSVFVLYEIQGFKYKEISKSLDMPINSVKVYLLRARKKLQEELKSYELQEAI